MHRSHAIVTLPQHRLHTAPTLPPHSSNPLLLRPHAAPTQPPCHLHAAPKSPQRRPSAPATPHHAVSIPQQRRRNAAATWQRYPHAALTPPPPAARSSHAAITPAECLLHAARTPLAHRCNAATTPPSRRCTQASRRCMQPSHSRRAALTPLHAAAHCPHASPPSRLLPPPIHLIQRRDAHTPPQRRPRTALAALRPFSPRITREQACPAAANDFIGGGGRARMGLDGDGVSGRAGPG